MKLKIYSVEYTTIDAEYVVKFCRGNTRINLANAMRLAEKHINHNPVVKCGKEVIWNGVIV